MNKSFAMPFIVFLCNTLFAQDAEIRSMIDSLKFIKADTLDCKSDLYWRIVARGKPAISILIDKLTDTVQTNIKFRCKDGRLNVGEIAHFALNQIAEFPTFLVTKIQFDFTDNNNCWIFYEFLFDKKNKSLYQTNIRDWYNRENKKYKAKRILKKNQTRCQKEFGIHTFYRWKGKY